MERSFLVLTKKKDFSLEDEKKIFINEFFSGYGNDSLKENVDSKFFITFRETRMEDFKRDIINALSKELNDFHNVCFSRKYWEKILNSWISRILANVYCKYFRAKYILKEYEKKPLVLRLLNNDDWQYMQDITDYILAEQSEKYDFQLWTEVFNKLCEYHQAQVSYVSYGDEIEDDRTCEPWKREIETKDDDRCQHCCKKINKIYALIKEGRFKEGACFTGRTIIEEIGISKQSKMYMYYSGFNDVLFNQLVVYSKGRIKAIPRKCVSRDYRIKRGYEKDFILRGERRQLIQHTLNQIKVNSDEKVIVKIILEEMPLCYIELFSKMRFQYQPYIKPNVHYLLSQHGAYMNTVFLFYAAEMHEVHDSRLIGIQHGGNYQLVKFPFGDLFLSDLFFTWGKATGNPKFIPSAPYKLETYKLKKTNMSLEKDKILFVGTCFPPYLLFAERDNMDTIGKINNQICFFSSLQDTVLKHMLIREFMYEYGWSIHTILNKQVSGLIFDQLRNGVDDFFIKMSQSRMVIFDHFQTAWLEALAINKPFLMFFEDDAYIFLDSEKIYLKMLMSVGILHNNPESAAQQVNKIYGHIDEWWNEPKRKEVVQLVRDRYWNDFGDPNTWWRNELLNLVKSRR